jgi:hypothetical protein
MNTISTVKLAPVSKKMLGKYNPGSTPNDQGLMRTMTLIHLNWALGLAFLVYPIYLQY